MKGLIFNNKENALNAAQFEAISMAEKKFNVVFDNAKVIGSDAWLIKGGTTQCTCGETSCVEVVLFADYLSNDMIAPHYRSVLYNRNLDIKHMVDGEQFITAYGYCDSCGSENPMS